MVETVVDFYFGLSSRYSYLAHTQINRLSKEYKVTFNWKPLFSPDLMDRRGQNPFMMAPPSGAYDVDYRLGDVRRWAGFYAIPYVEIDGRLEGDRRLFSHAAVAGAWFGKAEEMSRAIFARMFTTKATTLTADDLAALAAEIGIDPAAFKTALDAPDTQALHDAHIDDAIAVGAFGVPTFVCDGQLWFGNDRLVLLEKWLQQRS